MPTLPLPPEDRLLPALERLRRLDAAPLPLGGLRLSAPQAALLAAVAASQGAGLHSLADVLDLAPPTVSVTVARLEAAGLVQRRPDPHDGRAIRIYLTERGEALHRRLLAARRDRATRLLAPLAPEERFLLVDLLERALTAASIPAPDALAPAGRSGIAGLLRRVRGVLGTRRD